MTRVEKKSIYSIFTSRHVWEKFLAADTLSSCTDPGRTVVGESLESNKQLKEC